MFDSSIDSLVGFFKSFLNTLLDAIKDVFVWLFDMCLSLVVVLLDGLGSSFSFNPAEYIAVLPPELINITGLIGLGEAMTIVIAGIITRLLLQLIPFVRLGS